MVHRVVKILNTKSTQVIIDEKSLVLNFRNRTQGPVRATGADFQDFLPHCTLQSSVLINAWVMNTVWDIRL